MIIEGNFCNIDEIALGLFMAYGIDEDGNKFHMTTIGLLIFEINFIIYLNDETETNQ